MLENIRKFAASPLGKAVFILVLVAFGSGFWYFGNPMAPDDDSNWIVRIGERAISIDTARGDYQRQLNQLRAQSGGQFDSDDARAMGLPSLIVTRLINQALLDQAAYDMRLYASDDLVRSAILSNPAFRGPTDTFDRDVYAQTLRQNGFTERQFEALVRSELERDQLVSSLTAAVAVPRSLLASLYRFENETRMAKVVRIPHGSISDLPTATEKELRAFHRENAEQFTAPEYRSLTAVILRVDDLAEEMAVSANEIRDAYADRADDYRVAERRRLLQMVLPSQAEAEAALERIREGVDFATVAEEEAGLGAEVIDVGEVTEDQLIPELADAAFNLDEGEVSTAVESPLGWHVIKATEILPAEEKPLTEVQDAIAKELARDKAVDAIYDVSSRLQDALGGGGTLEEASAQLNLPLLRLSAVSAEGRDKSGEQIANVPDELVATAFTLAQGEESLLVELGSEGYFVVRVDDVTPPALRPFDSIRDEVNQALNARRQAEAAEAAAADLAEAAGNGGDLSALAADHGFNVIETGPLNRAGRGTTDVPQPLIEALFEAEQGTPVVVSSADASFVAEVTEVSAPDLVEATDEGIAAFSGNLQQALDGDLVAQYLEALRQRHPVAVNSRVMDQLF